MQFTEEDLPLMKLIFNPSTHDMGMLVGRERAEEIFEYVCDEIDYNKGDLFKRPSFFFERILTNENICDFFWNNNILDISIFDSSDIEWVLNYSPIAENIWDSERLYLNKLDDGDIFWILENSSIAEKIWDSGKLDLSSLPYWQLEHLKKKFKH